MSSSGGLRHLIQFVSSRAMLAVGTLSIEWLGDLVIE
jgi:hypothetical protein